MSQAKSYAAFSADKPLAPFTFDRREPRPDDVAIEILYCGVCHSDLHFARNDWGMSQYPVVPGHEIVGRVTAVGSDVSRFKAGDLVVFPNEFKGTWEVKKALKKQFKHQDGNFVKCALSRFKILKNKFKSNS